MTPVERPMVFARKRPGRATQFFDVVTTDAPGAHVAKDRFGDVVAAVGHDRNEAARLLLEKVESLRPKAKRGGAHA